MSKTKKRKIGDLGEKIICNYLKDNGFDIIERNYQKPWGEIDIIVKKQEVIHFVEVKTVTLNNPEIVSYETLLDNNNFIHKIKKCVLCKNFSFKSLKEPSVGFRKKFVFSGLFKQESAGSVSCGTKEENNVSCGTLLDKKNVPHETFFDKNNFYNRTKSREEKIAREKNIGKIKKIRDLNKYRPEDNLHPWKLKRLSRVIQTYLLSKSVPRETNKGVEEISWQFDVAVVYLNIKDKLAKVEYLEDIIL